MHYHDKSVTVTTTCIKKNLKYCLKINETWPNLNTALNTMPAFEDHGPFSNL